MRDVSSSVCMPGMLTAVTGCSNDRRREIALLGSVSRLEPRAESVEAVADVAIG